MCGASAGNCQPSQAVNVVRAPPRVQRLEQLRSKAEAVVPHCRHVRKVVGPHVQLPQHTLEREQESALDMGSEEVSRACSERSSDPQETSSPNLLPSTANGGNTPPVMNRQPGLSITTW